MNSYNIRIIMMKMMENEENKWPGEPLIRLCLY